MCSIQHITLHRACWNVIGAQDEKSCLAVCIHEKISNLPARTQWILLSTIMERDAPSYHGPLVTSACLLTTIMRHYDAI
jgi:hypothetical protein